MNEGCDEGEADSNTCSIHDLNQLTGDSALILTFETTSRMLFLLKELESEFRCQNLQSSGTCLVSKRN